MAKVIKLPKPRLKSEVSLEEALMETYLIGGEVEGLEPGIYHYSPFRNSNDWSL